MNHGTRALAGIALAALMQAAGPAFAANECGVEYGYHTGTGTNRKDVTTSITMNAGQTSTLNRSNMNFVRNTGNNKVDVTLSGAAQNNFTLDKGHRNPGVGFYLTPTTLQKLFCTHGAGAGAATTADQLINQMKQANATATQIAQAVKNQFNLTGQQVAQLLKNAGYTAGQVAAALASAFNATGAQVAAWLQAAGYTGQQVVAALKAQFNATATQAAQWAKAAFNATGAQMAAWLQAAGYTGEQVAAALKAQFNATAQQAGAWLKTAFNATAQQLAGWLKVAGYTLVQVAEALEGLDFQPQQIVTALRNGYNATADQVVQALKTLNVIMTGLTCAIACDQPATLMKVAGYAAGETIKALKTHFNIGVQTARDIADKVFALSGAALEQALVFAGYTAQQIASVTGRIERAASGVAAGAMELRHVVVGTFRYCDRFPSGYTVYGIASAPSLPMPNTNAVFTVTLVGNAALAAASEIRNLPSGASHTIRERGACFLVVDFRVPSTARVGATGTGVVMAGSQSGAGFAWHVGPRSSPTGSPATTGQPAVSPSTLVGTLASSLYVIGGGTTTDDANNNYTALDPFNNSAFCQTVAQPNPATTPNGLQRATRQTVNVAPITWRVRNNGGSAVTSVVAELIKEQRVVATQTINTLNPGQEVSFTYSRPNNSTCVARVGAGNGCYHCGTAGEGWNDNGLFVRIR